MFKSLFKKKEVLTPSQIIEGISKSADALGVSSEERLQMMHRGLVDFPELIKSLPEVDIKKDVDQSADSHKNIQSNTVTYKLPREWSKKGEILDIRGIESPNDNSGLSIAESKIDYIINQMAKDDRYVKKEWMSMSNCLGNTSSPIRREFFIRRNDLFTDMINLESTNSKYISIRHVFNVSSTELVVAAKSLGYLDYRSIMRRGQLLLPIVNQAICHHCKVTKNERGHSLLWNSENFIEILPALIKQALKDEGIKIT